MLVCVSCLRASGKGGGREGRGGEGRGGGNHMTL